MSASSNDLLFAFRPHIPDTPSSLRSFTDRLTANDFEWVFEMIGEHKKKNERFEDQLKEMKDELERDFEISGKLFQMVAGRYEEVYSLGRAWVKGVMNSKYEPINTKRTEFALNLPTEYLARREIHRMPRPDNNVEDLPICPTAIDKFNKDVDPRYLPELRSEYIRHWKEVKKGWCAHQRRREARFAKSVELIEKAYQPFDTSDTNDSPAMDRKTEGLVENLTELKIQ